jgi:sporulation protein YlmC with PRC-barrel domain
MNNANLEKENRMGKNVDGPHVNFSVRLLTATSIIGDKVENTKGERLGKIKDIMLNVKEGTIEYVVIEVGGFFGIGAKLFAVPFSALKLHLKNEDFILDVDKEWMDKMPGFDKKHWPETNGHYPLAQHWGNFMGPNVG